MLRNKKSIFKNTQQQHDTGTTERYEICSSCRRKNILDPNLIFMLKVLKIFQYEILT